MWGGGGGDIYTDDAYLDMSVYLITMAIDVYALFNFYFHIFFIFTYRVDLMTSACEERREKYFLF